MSGWQNRQVDFAEVEGLRELRKALKAAGDDLRDLREANRSVGEIVQHEAWRLVPVRTGQLQRTIRAAGAVGFAAVRSGTVRVPYAGPIHFGWAKRGIEPNPFLYDAADNRKAEVVETYWKSLGQIFDDEGLT